MKQYLVFTENDARFEWAEDPGHLKGLWLDSWDLSQVEGMSPEFWKYSPDGKVQPMNAFEMVARLAHRDEFGVDANYRHARSHFESGRRQFNLVWFYVAAGAAAAIGLLYFLGVVQP
jgi:hypothetical protein